jgi:hypothetical protein
MLRRFGRRSYSANTDLSPEDTRRVQGERQSTHANQEPCPTGIRGIEGRPQQSAHRAHCTLRKDVALPYLGE